MLRINRLRVEINTVNGVYGIDTSFSSGLNFIASEDNTCGKSSILAAIYYCLGLEQIIGGTGGIGSKVLTSVFKSEIEDNQNSYRVLESGAYLEISNGYDTVTIYRNIVSESKDNRLVSVYYSTYDAIKDQKTQASDFYVNIQNAATSEKGFHNFLEEFLHISLPMVGTSDGNERKLYLQIIFSAMFIEQKHGWSDILSGMPVLGIRESKKRVVEFLLDLDTIKNEKERVRLRNVKIQIEKDWEKRIEAFQYYVTSHGGAVINLPLHPRVLNDNDYARIAIFSDRNEPIADAIQKLQDQYNSICLLKPRVIDNFNELNSELSETLKSIRNLEKDEDHITTELSFESDSIQHLEKDIALIDADIRNNNDAARLQNFGSDNSTDNCSSICPVCNQEIHDNMILAKSNFVFMDMADRQLKKKQSGVFEQLNEIIAENFDKMFNDGEKYAKLEDDYRIHVYYHSVGGSMDYEEQNLSNGEATAINFVYIVSVLELARRKAAEEADEGEMDSGIINLPLVLDGPFSTLSNENTSLVAKKLPEFAEQVIIFMLDKDWASSGLEEFVLPEYCYRVKKEEKANSSTIERGGFE